MEREDGDAVLFCASCWPFPDGRDCRRKLRDGLPEQLAERDGIRVEVGVRTVDGRGVLLFPYVQENAVQTIPA